ncbi:ExeM/NucH family extracellular endonuclease [Variovorax sp. ZS18.2.2]|uniref:ExeM/NucH family extracellular endonuclease n=1 Tax=Variovorax sp. ZS18.2.2 TaxID=2971255 RepID=UPI002151D252|nr:ExeM/NucH family extracellular endonuclease [Variovorax sp. ZS18.2.2]MCR6478592.1 ExeM/NucH family extracellular endonuclease [Variovorax sp. ZS18.2.2]
MTHPASRPLWQFKTLALTLALVLTACGGGGNGGASFPLIPPPSGNAPPVTTPPETPPVTPPTCSAAVPANAPLTAISAIQGTGDLSPMAAQAVTVRGVVVGDFQNTGTTSVKLNGFFVQQLVPDADPATSEGIFVYAPGAATRVAVGDYVQVSGAVTEFGQTAGASAKPDAITQIAGTSGDPLAISVCGSGVVIAPTQITLPVADESTLERYEGMLVEIAQPLAVTELFELGRYGQMVLSLNGRQFNFTNGNAAATHAQNLLSRIVLDDGASPQNPNPIPYLSAPGTDGTRRMGDTTQKVTGILSHNFGAYRIQPTVAPVFAETNARQPTAPVVNGALKVASFNVLNYFTTFLNGETASGQTGQGCSFGTGPAAAANCRGANNLNEFQRQQAKIVAAIAGLDADVLGLMEIQNTDVATDDLLAALNAKVGAGTYAAVHSGVFGTDAIKVDILYKPAKVQRVGNAVLPTGTDLTDYTAASGRPPLAQRFSAVGNNGGFWFVVNHFKSKGSCPSTGDIDQGQGCFNLARIQQAKALNSFVAKLKLMGAPQTEADVLMMGDFNSYLLEDPTKELEAVGNESLLKRMPANDRYTYVFGGETGALDHSYASDSLKTQVSGVSVWHINSDEPTALDYNTDFTTDDRYAPTPFRASDHDPVLVGLTLAADAAVTQPIVTASIPSAVKVGETYSVNISEATPGGTATVTSLSVDWGDGTAATTAPGTGVVTHTYAAAGTFNIVVTLTNSAGQTATQSGGVTVSTVVVVTPPGAPDLFISEYVEGSATNKALEIYNPTASAVDLSLYTLNLYSNGAAAPSNSAPLTGSLPAGGVLVLANNGATAAFKPPGTVINSTVINFNGDDALTLEKSGVVIDRFGQVGTDPGTEWTGVGGISTLNQTLRRKPTIKAGDRNPGLAFDPSVQWDSFPIDTSAGLGAHTVN